jgi:hypothetical protein
LIRNRLIYWLEQFGLVLKTVKVEVDALKRDLNNLKYKLQASTLFEPSDLQQNENELVFKNKKLAEKKVRIGEWGCFSQNVW